VCLLPSCLPYRPDKGRLHTHRLFAGVGFVSGRGVFHTYRHYRCRWSVWFWTLHKKDVYVYRNRKRNLLVLLYLRRKYKKRERQYWIHPILAVRYLEGSFYTLIAKLKRHDSKFFDVWVTGDALKWLYKGRRYCNESLCLCPSERDVSSDN